VATVFDYHGLDPYGLNKPIYDENDGRRHWADGEIIDRICEDFPPDHLFGLFGTTPGQLGKVLRSAGLEASWAASTNTGNGRQQVWQEVKRSVEASLPVIVSMDMGKLGSTEWEIPTCTWRTPRTLLWYPRRDSCARSSVGSCSRASTTAPSSLIRRPLFLYKQPRLSPLPERAFWTSRQF
jgi:hypothetical protein